ncbi:MAG: VCBS repeat-containing protein [Planctomycetota bacterium]|nr:MAG: VCBS repeat-containing protein [Planctomycetota bacterium]
MDIFLLALSIKAQLPEEPQAIHVPAYLEDSADLQDPRLDGGSLEIEIADLHGDGHLDLVMIGDHGSPGINTNQHGITVWQGNGAGRWLLVQTGQFGYGGIAVGDVNNDGFQDVGYGMHHNYSGQDFGDQLLEVALGDGSAASWTPWDDGLATSGETWGMAATDFGDVDADGDLDLASISFGCCSGVHVYRNLGTGQWQSSYGFLGGNSGEECFFAELNGDGHLDLVVASDQVTVLLGDGTGSFQAADGGLPGGPMRTGLSAGDLDFDGRQELCFILAGAPSVHRFDGQQWQPVATQGLPASGNFQKSLWIDANADGRLDLWLFGRGEGGLWLGLGNGRFRRANRISTPGPGYVEVLRAADVDHNGFPDLLLVAEEGGLFSSRNRLRLFRETAVATSWDLRVTAPWRRAVLRAGAVHTLRWTAAVPAGNLPALTVELSTQGPNGPWTVLGAAIPNHGHWQWQVPATTSNRCFLRLDLRNAGHSMATARCGPFEIR